MEANVGRFVRSLTCERQFTSAVLGNLKRIPEK